MNDESTEWISIDDYKGQTFSILDFQFTCPLVIRYPVVTDLEIEEREDR